MRTGSPADTWKVGPLGGTGHTITVSPDPQAVHLSNPSVLILSSGRIIVSVDQAGPGLKGLHGAKGRHQATGRQVQGILLASSDRGESWEEKSRYPFTHARLFRDGPTIHVLGHKGNLQIMKSASGGERWDRPANLTGVNDADFTLGPANVLAARDHIYAACMTNTDTAYRGDPASVLAPIVLRAAAGAALTQAREWTRLQPPTAFRDFVPYDELRHFGTPFYDVPNPRHGENLGKGRWANRVGWQDSHLVQLTDPRHAWYDPTGRSFHLIARAHTHRGNYAVLARITEDEEGRMTLAPQTTPAGTPWTFLPLPGASRRFALVHDGPSERFWLLSNQVRDSLSDPAAGTSALPCDRRGPLQLSFSRNLVDWSFAGCIDAGGDGWGIAHDPHMQAQGDQLLVVARAVRRKEKGARTDAIRGWIIPAFRDLIY
jgi:hypothetical protein